jgi:hypothetical protein
MANASILLPQSVDRERWGFIRPDGSWAMPPRFAFAWPFTEGVAAVRKDDRMGYICPDGSEALPFRYLRAGQFEKGRSEVETETGMGVIRPDGSFALEPRFEFVWRDEWKGRDVFRTDGKDGRHALFDFDGNELLPPRDGDFFPLDFGLLAVERDGRWGVAAEDGRFVVPPEYGNVSGFDERGWCCGDRGLGEDGPTVFFDREGRAVLAPDVDHAESFFDDLAVARRDGKWGAIDREGQTVLPFRFDGAMAVSEGLFSVFAATGEPDEWGDRAGHWCFVRPDGEAAFPDRFETAEPFEDGIAWCEAKNGRWGPFLRDEGRFLVPPVYDEPGWESGPFLSGWKNGEELMNWFDRSGRIVAPQTI